MDLISDFKEKAKKRMRRIVLPESADERVIEAAKKVAREGFARVTLLGDPAAIKIPGVEVVSIEKNLERFAAAYAKKRANMTVEIARKMVKKPLFHGAMMVAEGDADGMVAGSASATASVIQAAALAIGLADGVSAPSSFFIMVIPEMLGEKNKVLIYADAAVSVAPSARELAEIAVLSGRNMKKLLGMEPRIAMLSFSTKGSASHACVDKVIEATRLARELAPDLAIDGEMQADTALVPRVAAKKIKGGSPVAGQANVLVFPDLDAANIAYKLTQYTAGAVALGPIMQGFRKPVNDLSRGASVDDIAGVVAITALRADA